MTVITSDLLVYLSPVKDSKKKYFQKVKYYLNGRCWTNADIYLSIFMHVIKYFSKNHIGIPLHYMLLTQTQLLRLCCFCSFMFILCLPENYEHNIVGNMQFLWEYNNNNIIFII